MLKILKYTFYDLVRSHWSYIYLAFYMALGFVLLYLNNDLSKAVITIMNIIVVLTPLIGTIFGVMYFYNSREFLELLLGQPIKRSNIFLGLYLGISFSLTFSLVAGLGIPFLLYGITHSPEIWNFGFLLVSGAFLTFIFVAFAMLISLLFDNRVKGFGFALLIWLFMAVIYDGLFLIILMVFSDYPLDTFTISASILNPIDLSRILILLKLDISALMGYTGAVFQKFFGTGQGLFLSILALCIWILIPVGLIVKVGARKDF